MRPYSNQCQKLTSHSLDCSRSMKCHPSLSRSPYYEKNSKCLIPDKPHIVAWMTWKEAWSTHIFPEESKRDPLSPLPFLAYDAPCKLICCGQDLVSGYGSFSCTASLSIQKLSTPHITIISQVGPSFLLCVPESWHHLFVTYIHKNLHSTTLEWLLRFQNMHQIRGMRFPSLMS